MNPDKTSRSLSLAAFAAMLLGLGSAHAAQAAEKNVLVFFVDDLRPELGCYGADYIRSPNIDRLASEGVRFDRAYCQQAVCAPSRISMLTGQRPDTTGIYDLFMPVTRKHPDAMTLPRHFQERGYVTASFGKVYHHADDDSERWTERPGAPGRNYTDPATVASVERRFEEAREKGLTGGQLSAYTKGPATEVFDGDDEGYRDGVVAGQAIESLRRNKDRPFFMCVGFSKPHLPFAAPKRYWDMYRREQFTVPERELPEGTPSFAVTDWRELRNYEGIPKEGHLSDELTRELKHGYAACVSYMDAQVGKVMAELERLGLRENTIVVLWGDHGYKLGEHGLWCKHSNMEMDTRVPLIVSAPGFARQAHSTALVEIVDLFPTLAALTGGATPASCEGASLEPVLKDPSRSFRDTALSQFPRGKVMGYSLRTDRWRYTEWVDTSDGRVTAAELHDLGAGRLSDANLAADAGHLEVVGALSAQLRARRNGSPSQ